MFLSLSTPSLSSLCACFIPQIAFSQSVWALSTDEENFSFCKRESKRLWRALELARLSPPACLPACLPVSQSWFLYCCPSSSSSSSSSSYFAYLNELSPRRVKSPRHARRHVAPWNDETTSRPTRNAVSLFRVNSSSSSSSSLKSNKTVKVYAAHRTRTCFPSFFFILVTITFCSSFFFLSFSPRTLRSFFIGCGRAGRQAASAALVTARHRSGVVGDAWLHRAAGEMLFF